MRVTFKGKPLIPSKYLEAGDLNGKRVAVTIESIKHVRLPARNEGDPDEARPLFRLAGKEKGWVLNTTNLESIAEVYGWAADGWIGKVVVIYGTKVRAFGKTSLAIRVDIDETQRRSQQPAHVKSTQPAEPAHDPETGEVTDDTGIGPPAMTEQESTDAEQAVEQQ